jgi:hypothetical protein
VSEEKPYRIRRADGRWYAGRGADRGPKWTANGAEVYRFGQENVALGVVRWLSHLGFETEVVKDE